VIGILIGTYSSVFVASPIVLFWHNFADRRKRKFSPALAGGGTVARPEVVPGPVTGAPKAAGKPLAKKAK
jgi:hypothetical protein